MNLRLLRIGMPAIWCLSVSVTSIIHAQSGTDRARELFKQGRLLVADGRYSEACALFEESRTIEDGIGTGFNLADCWEHQGLTASARDLFLRVAEQASESGQEERAQAATARAVQLAPKLSKLEVRIASEDAQIQVYRDDKAVHGENWRKATAVDPGHYTVKLFRRGEQTWATEVDVPVRATTVLVTPPQQDESSFGKTPPVIAEPERTSPPLARRLHADPRGGGQRAESRSLPPAPRHEQNGTNGRSSLVPTAALITGIGGVAAGTVFALVYKSKNDEAKATCPLGVGCTDAEIREHDSLVSGAKSARAVMYAGYGVGVVGLALATIFYSSRSSNGAHDSAGLHVEPTIGAEPTAFFGAQARGTW